jgi:YggT family protein
MFLQSFVTLLFRILEFAVFIRVILSWVNPVPQYGNPIYNILYQITEPILAPIRRFTTFGMTDFSPFVALIGLQILENVILRLLVGR